MMFLKKSVAFAFSLSMLLSFPAFAADEESGNPVTADPSASSEFVQDAFEAANAGIEVMFNFFPQSVYRVYTQEGFVTDVRLEAGETLKFIGGGDTARWKIDTAVSGSPGSTVTHIYIKPTQRGISTNLVINTDRRSYQLLLESGYSYNPMVSWFYPKSDLEIAEEKRVKSYSAINPASLDFGYKISDTKLKWSPVEVFRSDTKTYLKMKSDIVNTELPALFAIDDDKKMVLLSYRYQDGYFIVDRVLDKAVLVLGRKKVKIEYRYED